MAEVDFTQDIVANGDFGEATNGAKTKSDPNDPAASNGASSLPKGADDNSAEDRKVFIGGLSWETREPQLKSYFETYGEVESVNLKLNPMTGRSRCFAFVVFKDAASISKVFEAGDHAINSKKVDVKRAKAKPGKMFVGGLKPELTDEAIKEHFEKFGTILEFEMPFDKIKNQRKGFGFITFEREETMKDLIKKGKETIGEHEVDLKKATPRADPFAFSQGGPGGFDGYGYDYYGGPGPYGADYYYGGGGGAWGGAMGYGGWGSYGGARGGGKMRGRGGPRGRPY